VLFSIDKSVLDLFKGRIARQTHIDGLNNLLLGVAEGSHRIHGVRSVLQPLAECVELTGKARAVLRRAVGRISQEGALNRQLCAYGVVRGDGPPGPTSTSVGAQRIITFPIEWFDSTAKIQPTQIIGENLTDADVFDIVGKCGCVISRVPYLPIKANAVHGGGSTVRQVVRRSVQQSHISLCIVDSDRACPGGDLGGTASALQQFKNVANFPIIEVLETHGRDLENALPTSYYESSCSAHKQTSVLSNLNQGGEHEVLAHLDIERGFTLRTLFAMNGAERDFWDSKIQILLQHSGQVASSVPCLATGVCGLPGTQPCQCILVHGNSANHLQCFHDQFGSATGYEVLEALDLRVRAEWSHLGGVIAAWCCADTRLRD
jgi:hypothetical protein